MEPRTWPLLLTAVALVMVVTPPLVGCGGNRATEAEIERILQKIRSEDRVESTSAAISCQHLVRRQSRFSLLDRTELHWWQERLRPAVPVLVEMLTDERGLEWVDSNGNTEQVTTPRKEARLTLVALGRASVDALIAALDRPELARKSDEVLRQIVGGGPADASRASWQRFWAERAQDGLPDEQGRLLQVLLAALGLAGVMTAFIWLQRRRQRDLEGKRLRLAVAAAAASPTDTPAVGTSEPAVPADPKRPPDQNVKT